jgi:stage V sporulation protein AC
MNMKKEKYGKYVSSVTPRSPIFKDCLWAFSVGGVICCIGQGLIDIYMNFLNMSEKDAGALCSVTLVFIAALLTGLGVFDDIARRAGAGTLVPITGFANSVVSPAIDSKSEGLVLGVGAKIFTVAGPVLLYGTLSGTLYGVIYWVYLMFTK